MFQIIPSKNHFKTFFNPTSNEKALRVYIKNKINLCNINGLILADAPKLVFNKTTLFIYAANFDFMTTILRCDPVVFHYFKMRILPNIAINIMKTCGKMTSVPALIINYDGYIMSQGYLHGGKSIRVKTQLEGV